MKWYTINYININDHRESGTFNVYCSNIEEARKIGEKQIQEISHFDNGKLEITHIFTSPFYN